MKTTLTLFATLLSLTHVAFSLPLSPRDTSSNNKIEVPKKDAEPSQTPGSGATNIFNGNTGGNLGSNLLGAGGGNGPLGGAVTPGFDLFGGGNGNIMGRTLSTVSGVLPASGNILAARKKDGSEPPQTPGSGATNIFNGALGGNLGSNLLPGESGGSGLVSGALTPGFDVLGGGNGNVVGDTLGTLFGVLPALGGNILG